MDKLEFSDIYKFGASVGLILMGLSFLVPWFVNHENSFLLINVKTLNTLTPVAKSIILSQQTALNSVNNYILYLSVFIFIMGISLLTWSLTQWKRRQSILDEIQNEDLKYKQIQNVSATEKREILENDIKTELISNQAPESSEPIGIANEELEKKIDDYIAIEDKIFGSLYARAGSNFEAPLQNVRIMDRTFDIIMKAKKGTVFKDRLIEIKYFSEPLNLESLKLIVQKIISRSKFYSLTIKRSSIPILLIVYSANEFPDLILQYKIQLEKLAIKEEQSIRINFYSKSKIELDESINFLADYPKIT